MAEQYFSANPSSESRPQEHTVLWQGKEYPFTTDAGVFSKGGFDEGSRLLLGTLPALSKGQRGLDLGCGWGPIGTLWALSSPEAELVLTDINERAAGLARENVLRNGAANVTVCCGDALAAVEGEFDAIACNPPIRTGKENIYRMLRDAMSRLRPGGGLYIVIRVKQGADSAKRMLRTEYGNCETIERGGGYHVLLCRRAE